MKKGRLTIFTGYSSGVGKSHIMLQRATQEFGDNVIVAYLNEQQRKIRDITERKEKTKKAYSINELISNGENKVVVLDEMGMGQKCIEHSSFIYEDIEILLNNGIDVYTSANIKRFSGINEKFRKISGIGIKKTIPAKFLDMAEQIVLVCREPEELIIDYKMGKLFNEKNQKSNITKKNFSPYVLEEYQKLTFEILKEYEEKVEIVHNTVSSEKKIKKKNTF